jgi:hypothetical protein
MSRLDEVLVKLFRGHGVEAVSQGEAIVFPGRSITASAAIVNERKQGNVTNLQLDVRLHLSHGRTLIESFAGFDVGRDKAIDNALANFTANSFHVLLAAFFQPDDHQVTHEEWNVGGRAAHVTLGNVGVRGKLPLEGKPMFAWSRHFLNCVKQQSLRPGIHWVRLYYAHSKHKAIACEILLDNLIWETVAAEMAAFDWPAAEEFYSVRIFLVLDVQKGGEVSPTDAVPWIADILGPWPDYTEDQAYAAMADAGIPNAIADRAYKLLQVAWGRALLNGLGIQFSPKYLCCNAAGEVVESGNLVNEPYFAAATRLTARYKGSPGFKRLALMSADLNAVNNALNAGSKATDLVMGPACVFIEVPTAAGVEAAHRAIQQHMDPLPKPSKSPQKKPAKPWWQF